MSGYIGPAPVPQATQTREAFTATSGQTTFNTGGYTAGFIDVYLNGVKLAAADYTATNGSDVVLAVGAAADDILETVAYSAFTVADQTFTGDIVMSDGLTVDNDGATVLTVDRATSDGTIIDVQKNGSTVGSIGTAGGDLWIGSSAASHAAMRFANGSMFPVSNTGGSSDGLVSVGDPLARFKDLYLSGGVYLGGTGSANLLDDYEEGTWTPAFKGYSGSYVLQGGHYTKVGRIVTIAGTAYGNSGTNASGAFKITGLPFPAQSSGDTDYHPVFVNVERAVRNLSDLNYMSMITPSGTEIWFFRDNGNTGGMTQLVWGTDFDSNSRFRFNASYITSS